MHIYLIWEISQIVPVTLISFFLAMLHHNRMNFIEIPLGKWKSLDLALKKFPAFYRSKKVKWSRYRPGVAQRVGRGIALLFHDRGSRRGVSGQQHAPAALYPRGKTRYPFYRRLSGPQGRSGRTENLVHIRIRSRAVQPVVSRYTDWATVPTFIKVDVSLNFGFLGFWRFNVIFITLHMLYIYTIYRI